MDKHAFGYAPGDRVICFEESRWGTPGYVIAVADKVHKNGQLVVRHKSGRTETFNKYGSGIAGSSLHIVEASKQDAKAADRLRAITAAKRQRRWANRLDTLSRLNINDDRETILPELEALIAYVKGSEA